MHPVLWELNLGRLGQFTLGTYGLFYAAAFLVAVRLSMFYARKEGIDPARMIDLGIWVLLAGILGAKILLIVTDLPYYWHHKMQAVYNWRSAGVFYGGFLAAVLVGVLYVHRHRLPLGKTADAATPGLALAQAVGRLGCLAAGCCYGKPTTLFWSITFVDPRAHDLTGVPLGVPLHPTQILHGLADLCLFLFLVFFYRRKRSDGSVFWLYVLIYGVLRFAIEFLRGDFRGEVFGGLLSTSQLISIVAAAVAIYFLFRLKTTPRSA
jgi:phosphatidylglycerol---prolipoprotein diacylglyceryl transferase